MLRGVLRLAIQVVAGAKGSSAALRLALRRWRSLVETRYVVAEDAAGLPGGCQLGEWRGPSPWLEATAELAFTPELNHARKPPTIPTMAAHAAPVRCG
jgi:hypothetical protein